MLDRLGTLNIGFPRCCLCVILYSLVLFIVWFCANLWITEDEDAASDSDCGSEPRSLPVNWLNWYTYGRIPLGIAGLLLHPVDKMAYAELPRGAFAIGIVLAYIYLVLIICLLIGLHRKKLWGWRLNWVVLVLEVLLAPAARANNLVSYFVFLIGLLLFWLIPHTIYFSKRRCLFS